MKSARQIEPLTKSLELNCPIDHAFKVFTEKMDLWWPLKTHSCFEDVEAKISFDKRAGGEVIETSKSGKTNVWGKILAWEPPKMFSMTWHPANNESLATKLTVRFEMLSDSKTRILLVHEGWETRGEKANDMRKGYDSGWDGVLSLFQSCVEEKL